MHSEIKKKRREIKLFIIHYHQIIICIKEVHMIIINTECPKLERCAATCQGFFPTTIVNVFFNLGAEKLLELHPTSVLHLELLISNN